MLQSAIHISLFINPSEAVSLCIITRIYISTSYPKLRYLALIYIIQFVIRKVNKAVHTHQGSPSHHLEHLRLGSKPKLGPRSIEDNILALEKDIAEDGETNARVGLDTTVCLAVANRLEADIFAGHRGSVITNGDRKVRGSGRRWEDVATLAVVESSSIDLLVVGVDNAVVKEKESSTSV